MRGATKSKLTPEQTEIVRVKLEADGFERKEFPGTELINPSVSWQRVSQDSVSHVKTLDHWDGVSDAIDRTVQAPAYLMDLPVTFANVHVATSEDMMRAEQTLMFSDEALQPKKPSGT